MEQTLVLRILVPSSKETTGSGDENAGCVGSGGKEYLVLLVRSGAGCNQPAKTSVSPRSSSRETSSATKSEEKRMFSQANCNRLLLRWFPPYPSASLSAMKAEYIPLPPTPYPPPPPSYCRSTESNPLDETHYNGLSYILAFKLSRVAFTHPLSSTHPAPIFARAPFRFQLSLPRCRLHLVSIQVLRCKGVELEASCFFQKCCRT